MDCFEALLLFCQQHTPIYCYGAGDYGSYLYSYLKINHILVKGFIVSNLLVDTTKCDVPVHALSYYKSFSAGTGIILSLAHKHQADILKILEKKYSMVDVYELQDEVVEQFKTVSAVRRQKHIYELLENVFRHHTQYKNNDVSAESLVQAFCSQYTDIYLRYMDMRQIGSIAAWIYYVNERRKDNRPVFYLFCPYVYEQDRFNSERWMGVNHYLADKLSLSGIAMLSDSNLAFWQMILKKYLRIQHVIFDDQFQLFEYVRSFNFAATQYKKPLYIPQYISFTKEESKALSRQLQRMGVHSEFVCISARNSTYRCEITQNKSFTEDIIDRFRNTKIHSYCKAVSYLHERGLQTVRMGALVEAPIQEQGLIDYAFYYRTEALDVFLLSKCQFFVSDPSGIQFLGQLFSKPLVIINTTVLTTRNDLILLLDPTRDIAIPKKLWDTKHHRFLTFKDMLDIEINSFITNNKFVCGPQNAFLNYYERGIIPVDNTPAEIFDVVQEMWLRLHDRWIPNEQDEDLQRAYRQLVDRYPKGESFLFQWRIGAKFLRENTWILQ